VEGGGERARTGSDDSLERGFFHVFCFFFVFFLDCFKCFGPASGGCSFADALLLCGGILALESTLVDTPRPCSLARSS
jgi:hypothetical protein